MAPERQNVAIVLAAGQGVRMGHPKALLDAGQGQTFLGRLAATFTAAGLAPLAVLGADAARVRARHPELWAVDNPDWETGQWSTVRAGLSAALAEGARAVLVHPVDSPRLLTSTAASLLAALSTSPAAVAHHQGKPGHPVALAAEAAAAVLALPHVQSLAQALTELLPRPMPSGDPAVGENFNMPDEYRRAFGTEPRVA
jgi:molybdenum cofactor cytidylyltransferase